MPLFVPSGDDGDDDGNGTPLKVLLRWLLGRDRPESAALAGALAGLASFNYRFLFPYSSSLGLSPADFLCFCLS